MTNVLYRELPEHEYLHVARLDGEKLEVNEAGELLIFDRVRFKWNDAAQGVVPRRYYDKAAGWGFTDLKPGAYSLRQLEQYQLDKMLRNPTTGQ